MSKSTFNKDKETHVGRVSGTPNRISAKIKTALAKSLDSDGGAVAFFRQLRVDEPKTYAALIGKLLPRQLVGRDDEPLIPKAQTFDEKVDVCRRFAFLIAETDSELTDTMDIKPTPRPHYPRGQKK